MKHRLNYTRFRKPIHGFTLIELLVVIAIIALLLSVILPSLGKAKELAKGVLCASNLRQLSMAWVMYADEHNSRMVTGPVFQDTRDDPAQQAARGWAVGPIREDGTAVAAAAIEMEHRLLGIRKGKLFDYLGDEAVYHCPGDRRMKNPTNAAQRYRSYLLPDVLYGDLKTTNYSGISKRYDGKLLKKTTEITSPGTKYTFVESSSDPDDTRWGFDHSGWNFTPWIDKFWTDELAANHTESGCFAFADGHAEKHKWVNKNTSKQFKGEDFEVITYPDNEDVAWAWNHFPVSKR